MKHYRLFSVITGLLLAFSFAFFSPISSVHAQSGGTFHCSWNSTVGACRYQSNTCAAGYTWDNAACSGRPQASCVTDLPCIAGSNPGTLTTPAPTGPWWNQNPDQFAEKVSGAPPQEIFGERYTYAQVNWIINSICNMLDPLSGMPKESLLDLYNRITTLIKTTTMKPHTQDFAALGVPGLLLGSLSEIYANPAASGVDSIGHTLAKFDLVQPAYAQSGYGFGATSAIQFMWAASRNMAFLVIILLLIVAGFMIMFRVKINPQTVISVQLMIPRLIITMIAITFSYAIAGLCIDLVYLLLGFVISVLTLTGAIGTGTTAVAIFNWFATPSFFSRVFLIFLVPLIEVVMAGGITSIIASALLALGGLGTSIGSILAIIVIVFLAFIIWLLVKVWWMMVKTYLMLMFTIIIGPWQILLGLIPGDPKSSVGFGPWLRTILSQVSVFLVVPIMFILLIYFWSGMYFNLSAISPIGISHLGLGAGSFPQFPMFNSQGGLFGFIMGYAILSLIPKVAQMIQEAIKTPPFKYGTAFGEALGGARIAAGFGIGRLSQTENIVGERAGRGSADWADAQRNISNLNTIKNIIDSTKNI